MAIIHFTGPGAIGGIETWIQTQLSCLQSWGIAARLIVGAEPGSWPDVVCLPMMHPTAVACYPRDYDGFPPVDHPIVQALAGDLRAALQGCTECWVHNAFTVLLNPFLTIALRLLATESRDIPWVAWCEDISIVSAYWDAGDLDSLDFATRAVPGVRYVTISEARRRELARVLGLPEPQITVVPPPIDAACLLGIGERAREIAMRLDIAHSMPLVLVPAKLLPHKNLARAVDVAVALRRLSPRPLVLVTAALSPHEPERSQALATELRARARNSGVEDCFHLLPDVAGMLDHRTVRDLTLLADVVFLPSLEEGYGLPIQEAAALRVPVLSSRIPVFEETGAGPFFELDQTDDEIARMIWDLAMTPGNVARRAALQSQDRFRAQLAEILEHS